MSFFPGLAGGLIALIVATAGNRLIWRLGRDRGTAWLVPLWEEYVKTVIGVLTGQILLVHGVFGAGEAVYELNRGERAAGVAAIISHLFFGVLAYTGFRATSSFAVGWFCGSSVHVAWNRLVVYYSRHRSRKIPK